MIGKDLPIVIGDANGADKAIQAYPKDRGYRNVEVFCSGNHCRNNLGGWNVRTVASEKRNRSFSFYSVKDAVMAEAATIGLMVWDGKSVGTLFNAWRLVNQKKIAAIYAVPEKSFWNLKTAKDWNEFIDHCSNDVRRKLEQRANGAGVPMKSTAAQLSMIET